MDILAETLRAGTQVKEYITSYKNTSNELPHVTKCECLHNIINTLTQNDDLDFRDKFHYVYVSMHMYYLH